jgi:hypothetical protein
MAEPGDRAVAKTTGNPHPTLSQGEREKMWSEDFMGTHERQLRQ